MADMLRPVALYLGTNESHAQRYGLFTGLRKHFPGKFGDRGYWITN